MFAGDTLFYSHWIEIMPIICANITCVVGFVWICSFFCFGLFWCVFFARLTSWYRLFFCSEVHGDHRHAYSSGSLCPTLSGEGSVTSPERWFPGSCSKKKLRMTCRVHRWDKRAPGSDSMFSTPHLIEIASRFGTMKQLEVWHSSLLKSSPNKMTWDFCPSMIPTLQEFSSIHWSSLPKSHEVFPTFFMAFTLKNSAARSDKARRKRLSLGNV